MTIGLNIAVHETPRRRRLSPMPAASERRQCREGPHRAALRVVQRLADCSVCGTVHGSYSNARHATIVLACRRSWRSTRREERGYIL